MISRSNALTPYAFTHTYVDHSLRGKGIAAKLLELTADELRKTNRKAVPTCSYAVKWFEDHPEQTDIIDKKMHP